MTNANDIHSIVTVRSVAFEVERCLPYIVYSKYTMNHGGCCSSVEIGVLHDTATLSTTNSENMRTIVGSGCHASCLCNFYLHSPCYLDTGPFDFWSLSFFCLEIRASYSASL